MNSFLLMNSKLFRGKTPPYITTMSEFAFWLENACLILPPYLLNLIGKLAASIIQGPKFNLIHAHGQLKQLCVIDNFSYCFQWVCFCRCV